MAAAGAGLVACTGKSIIGVPGASGREISGEMEYRINPNTGDSVSLLGYGCMRWPTTEDDEGRKIIDQEAVNALVDRALEMGVNYFDSSPAYIQGQCDAATGIALSRHPRESYFIATKLSNFSNWTRENSIQMYRKSFEDFQTDHLDYYLLHSMGDEETFIRRFVDNGMVDFLVEERAKGNIRNLGFSFHGSRKGMDQLLAYHEKYHWDFCQIQMNYVDWEKDARYLYEELQKRGIPVIIMEPLLGGRLAKLPDYLRKQLLGRDAKRSAASWAFRFCGTFPGVLTVLSGMTWPEHLEDNLRSFCGFEPLSQEDMEFLSGVARAYSSTPLVNCTACQYCMPCPYGIDIPGIFAHYNKCVNEGLLEALPVDDEDGDQSSREFRRARRRYLADYDRAVPSYRQADHCIHCGRCRPQCPQHINIPATLQRIGDFAEALKQTRD